MIELTLFNDAAWICKGTRFLAPSKVFARASQECPYLQALLAAEAAPHSELLGARQQYEQWTAPRPRRAGSADYWMA